MKLKFEKNILVFNKNSKVNNDWEQNKNAEFLVYRKILKEKIV